MAKQLSTWNWVAAALHSGFALWALSLPTKKVTLYDFKFDVSVVPASDLDYALETQPGGTVDLKALVVAFFSVTALAHVAYATDIFGRGGYARAVTGYGWNPYRWLEYSVTASIMIFVIAVVAGAKETSQALVAALLTPGLMLQGLTVERELQQNATAAWASGAVSKRPTVDPVLVWFNFAPAWFFFALKWYIIWNAYLILKQDLDAAGRPLDPRITELVTIQFVGFTLFGVIQSFQVYGWVTNTRGHWTQAPYIGYEKAYIVLSLVVKAALGLSVARLLS